MAGAGWEGPRLVVAGWVWRGRGQGGVGVRAGVCGGGGGGRAGGARGCGGVADVPVVDVAFVAEVVVALAVVSRRSRLRIILLVRALGAVSIHLSSPMLAVRSEEHTSARQSP